jgi:hypothetical protein
MGSQSARSGSRRLPAMAYEREPGAAWLPLPRDYRRRKPENTALHIVMREHMETMFEEALRNPDSPGFPEFVRKDFERYLACGILAHGFSRLRCPSCGDEKLVAFSCKSRICPSCWARRTADTAAHLVDRVLPDVPYRQLVMTFPFTLRGHLAFHPGLFTRTINACLRTVFSWQRKRGRALGIRDGRTGAVTFIQRFGNAINLNPHLHTVMPDGLFVDGPGQELTFETLPPPSVEEIQALTFKISRRIASLAEAAGVGLDERTLAPEGDMMELGRATAEALVVPVPAPIMRDALKDAEPPRGLCANVDGFVLHAGRTVAAGDRKGLEQLCRYGLRSPISQERLSLLADGKVLYRLKRPWPTDRGVTELVWEPKKLLRRLAALLPFPYTNLVRYHGVFANRSRDRFRLPAPRSWASEAEGGPPAAAVPMISGGGQAVRPRRIGWARLLKRVLQVDALAYSFQCPAPKNVVYQVILQN